jgi:arginine decarboxylase
MNERTENLDKAHDDTEGMGMPTSLSHWSINSARNLYRTWRWGAGFFSVNSAGHISVHPEGNKKRSLDLYKLVQRVNAEGVSPPLLVRFPEIIQTRVRDLNNAFRNAIDEFHYDGKYIGVYPVKVNQYHDVIQTILDASQPFGGGLEAGSKAELFAVVAMTDHQTPIYCNGFKDNVYLEIALRAAMLGRDITLVIEKVDEVPRLISFIKMLGFVPKIGLRVKLASRVKGHWQGSSGSRSKFGLTTNELLEAVEQLKANGLHSAIDLLHFHTGSQINNVRTIKSALIEATRIYCGLVNQGVPLTKLDVGGGLAVDYTGDRNTKKSSMNYSLQEYANDVVYYVRTVCDQSSVEHPTLISESGRALVAHHSVLIVPIMATPQEGDTSEPLQTYRKESAQSHGQKLAPDPLQELAEILGEISESRLAECYHDAQQAIETVHQSFTNGVITLQQRALAERLYRQVCMHIQRCLDHVDFVPDELRDIGHELAETYHGNFSLFQSLPDSWAIGNLFPMAPIHRLDEPPTHRCTLADITCDSDGCIDAFAGSQGDERSIRLHHVEPGSSYWIGIFLVGAYQEVLGDNHNLFGKVHTVVVKSSKNSDQPTLSIRRGTHIRQVLSDVHHNINELMNRITSQIHDAAERSEIDQEQVAATTSFFENVISGYTYLRPDNEKNGANGRSSDESSASDNSDPMIEVVDHSRS